MNPVLWGGVGVLLLIAIAGVTMAKTRWGRPELNQPPAGLPRNNGRVSGHEDD
ncbi:MAG TPA: hypothetical protein VFS41_07635 [Edaphobacter sp.]|nr:hypothetical protein [Edaphobacter sp.]